MFELHYALRRLWRNPVLTLTILATLTLGIGAAAAVFSVVDRILFRPLPYAEPDRLVSVGLVAPIFPQEFMLGGSYYEWRDHQAPFEALTSETGVDPCNLNEERPVRLNCASVEANFLPTLGITPVLGRNFTAGEDRPGVPRVALISFQLWRSRFGGATGTVNQLVSLDGQPTRIIGVLPRSFEMPTLEVADIVVPEALDEAVQRHADPGRVMYAFARLKPGVSADQAMADLLPAFNYSLSLAPPQFRKEIHLQVRSLRDRQMHDVHLIAWVLLGVVAAVLLIVCANIASLLTARGLAREKELAVRSALGATRARLIGHAIAESLMLSVAGAIAGCGLAALFLHLFVAIAPEGMPFLMDARIDARIVLFAFLLSSICGILFGMVPAMRKPRAESLLGRTTATPARTAVQQGLVIAQIAVSMVLLAAGGLLFRSFEKLQGQELGMHTKQIVTARLSLGQKDYPTQQRQMAFFQQLERQLRYNPGTNLLAISDSLPPDGPHHDKIYAALIVEGRPKMTGGTGGMVTWRWVTPDYFRILGISLLRGEGFTEDERTSGKHQIVISKLLADRMFPGQNPIGQRLQLNAGGPNDPFVTVIGVAADVKNNGLAGESQPEYYRLRANAPQDWESSQIFLMQTALSPQVVEPMIRARVAALDPTLPVDMETLQQRVSRFADQPRFQTMLVGFFAATGLVLAIVGLYGVVSFLVVQRTQEIGVRMALGADRHNILRLILHRSLRLIVPGAMLGLLLSLAASRILSSLLFHVGPRDPVVFGCATLLLMGIALVATWLPARAAARVDPVIALRSE